MDTRDAPPRKILIHRHSLAVRLTHWVNVLCLTFLLLSGLQIFMAHPALYWGQYGANSDPSVLSIGAEQDGDGMRGVTRVGGLAFTTTGVLGVSDVDGVQRARTFPDWLTLPSYRDLATGRRWHFFFAWLLVINGLVYLLYGLFAGHFRRDLLPEGASSRPRISATRSPTMRACAFPRARRRAATTRCRSSPISG